MHEEFYIISMYYAKMPNENTYHIQGQCSATIGEMSQILKQQ